MYIKHKNSTQAGDEPYEKLGNAIILQAVRDYRLALSSLASSPSNTSATDTKREVERFFHSGLFGVITGLDPDMLIAKLNQEVES